MSVDINAAIADWLTNVFREIGDPDGLHEHAEDLQRQAEHVRAVHAQLAAEVGSSSWSGADYEAFSSAWQEHAKLAEDTATSLQATANQVDEHADRTWEIVKEIIGIALEILEILAAGIILSWLLAGIADLIWARVAPLINRIVQLLERFRTMLGNFTEWARKVGSTAGRVGEEIGRLIGRATEEVVGGLPANARAYGNFYMAQVVAQAMTGRPIDWDSIAWQTAVFFAMDIGNNMLLSLLKERVGIMGAVEETTARAGRRAESDVSSERSSAVDGAATETEGVASPGALSRDARRGEAGSGESEDAHPASATETGGTDAAMEIRAVRPESEGVPGEQGVPVSAEADASVSSTSGPADGAAVRGAAERGTSGDSGTGAKGGARSASISGGSEIPAFGEGNVTGTVRLVEAGGAEDEFLVYRGPSLPKSFESDGAPGIPLTETPVVKVPSSAEAHLGESARNGLREVDAAPATRPADTSATSVPGRPRIETPPAAQAHTDLASPPLPRTPESPATAREGEFDVAPLPNVEVDAANIEGILTPRSGSATGHIEIDTAKLPDTHKEFQPKSWGEAIVAGIQEGFLTAVGNIQTNAIVNHIKNADQSISGKDVINLVIGGAVAGVRHTAWNITAVGERFAYRNMPENSPTILRNVLSETVIQGAFYTIHMIIKAPIVNGVSGQMTPTEITQQDSQ